MIQKLYECGCFNYTTFILNNTKALSLSADEAFVLIAILDEYQKEKTVSINKLLQRLNMTLENISDVLAMLMEKEYYMIFISYDKDGIGSENVSLNGFFKRVEAVLNGKNDQGAEELFLANKLLQERLNRILQPTEVEVVSSLILESNYTLKDIEAACDRIQTKKRLLTIKSLAQELSTREKTVTSGTTGVLKDFMSQIK